MNASIRRFGALAAVLFAVALGYGAALPVLPAMLEHLMPGATREALSRHIGALTTAYMLAIIGFAPLWGRASDRFGRRPIVLLGIAGYALSLAAFAWTMSMAQAYALRFAAGMFAAAVLPAASAAASDLEDVEQRASWLAALGSASLLGYLAGPAITSVVYALVSDQSGAASLAERVGLPLYASAAAALLALTVAFHVLVEAPRQPFGASASAPMRGDFLQDALLAVAAMLGLGAFEVGVTVLAAQTLGYGASVLGLLFVECSAVMLVAQVLLAWKRTAASRFSAGIVATAFGVMAAGFVVLAAARNAGAMYVSVALIGGGAGTLLPLLAFSTSIRDRQRLGTRLGTQTAATSLGQAAGSVAGGWLYAALDVRSFWLYAIVMVVGAVAAMRR